LNFCIIEEYFIAGIANKTPKTPIKILITFTQNIELPVVIAGIKDKAKNPNKHIAAYR